MSTGSLMEVRVGGVTVDVPRTVGYYGGVAVAVGLGLVEPPLGLFIAAVPAIKALTHRAAPKAVRFAGEILEGGAKPVGGDADAVVRIDDPALEAERAAQVVALADRRRAAGTGGSPSPKPTKRAAASGR